MQVSEEDKMRTFLGNVADDWQELKLTLDVTNEKLARILLNCFLICKEVLLGTDTSNFGARLVDNGWPQWFVNGLETSQTFGQDGGENKQEDSSGAQEMETIKIKEEPFDSVEENSSSSVAAESRDALDGVCDIKSEPMDVETPSSSDCFIPTTTQESLQGLTMPEEPSGRANKEKQQMSIASDLPVPVGLVSRCGTSFEVTPIQDASQSSLLGNSASLQTEASLTKGHVQSSSSSKELGEKMLVKVQGFLHSKDKSSFIASGNQFSHSQASAHVDSVMTPSATAPESQNLAASSNVLASLRKSNPLVCMETESTQKPQDRNLEPHNTKKQIFPNQQNQDNSSPFMLDTIQKEEAIKNKMLFAHSKKTAKGGKILLVSKFPIVLGSNNSSESYSKHIKRKEVIQKTNISESNYESVQYSQNANVQVLQIPKVQVLQSSVSSSSPQLFQSKNICEPGVSNVSPMVSTVLATGGQVTPNLNQFLQLPANLNQNNVKAFPCFNLVNNQTLPLGIAPGIMNLSTPNQIINPLINVKQLMCPTLTNPQVTNTACLFTTTNFQANNIAPSSTVSDTCTLGGKAQDDGSKLKLVNYQTLSSGIASGTMNLAFPEGIINPLLNIQQLVCSNPQITNTACSFTTSTSQAHINLPMTHLSTVNSTIGDGDGDKVQNDSIKLEKVDSYDQEMTFDGNSGEENVAFTENDRSTSLVWPNSDSETDTDVDVKTEYNISSKAFASSVAMVDSAAAIDKETRNFRRVFLKVLMKKPPFENEKDAKELEVDEDGPCEDNKTREALAKTFFSHMRNISNNGNFQDSEYNNGNTTESEGENEDEEMEHEDENKEVQSTYVIQSKLQRTSRGRLVQMPNYGAMEKGFAISDESDLSDESDDAEKDSDWDLSLEEEIIQEKQDEAEEEEAEEIDGDNMDKNDEKADEIEEKKKPKPKRKLVVNLDDHQDKYEITKHISSHKSERNLTEEEKSYDQMTCKLCGEFSCILKKSMEEHLGLHLSKKLTCSKCGEIFNTTRTHNKHLREVHSKKLPIFICEICAKMFTRRKTLRCHMGKTHKQAVLPCYDKDCEEKFCSKEEMIAHAKDNHENTIYTCQTCGKQMQKLDHIVKRHSESINCQSLNVSGGETVCKICGKRVGFIGMSVHMRRHHAKIKTFNCQFCPYQTDKGHALHLHVKTHTGEHNHRCDQCYFTCIYYSQLVSHKRTHTGEKPYKCDLCPYAAAWNVQLKDHMKAHESSAKVACEMCKIVLKDKRALKMHMKKKH